VGVPTRRILSRLIARLLGAPPIRPRRDLVPNPMIGSALVFDRNRESRPVDKHGTNRYDDPRSGLPGGASAAFALTPGTLPDILLALTVTEC